MSSQIEPFDLSILDDTSWLDPHDVTSIQLRELISMGAFSWSDPRIDWKAYAYDEQTFARLCEYFEQRFMFREISVLPPGRWLQMLGSRIKFELCPKYNPIYAKTADGLDLFATEDRYGKRRNIESGYPETLLTGNSDYLKSGHDEEYEDVTAGDTFEKFTQLKAFHAIDQQFMDELESFFTSLYTVNVNGF